MILRKDLVLLPLLLVPSVGVLLITQSGCSLDTLGTAFCHQATPQPADFEDFSGMEQEASILLQMSVDRSRGTVQDVLQNEELVHTQGVWSFYHYSLIPLIVLSAIAAWFTRPKLDSPDDMTPSFCIYRTRFILVWSLASAADWLQGPYVYALYDSFGYDNHDIDKLFVIGFASSMVFSTFAGSLADAWGRKRTALLYCVLYIVSCLTKHCSVYGVLTFGRITGGMATALLFSAFEAWMVSESNERHHFSNALLRYMFSLMYFVNYLVAIVSGLVSQLFVDAVPMRIIQGYSSLHYGGYICPFDLAIVVLCLAFVAICFTWEENYGCSTSLQNKQAILEAFTAAFKAMTSSWKIVVIGLVVACFEGSMYTFVINWTPTLGLTGTGQLPHGIIFSAMMMCCMMGSSVFSFFNPDINPAKVLVAACSLSAVAFAVVVFQCEQVLSLPIVYMSFLVFEFCVGLYFPAIGALKSELVPEEARAGIYTWYRVPLNLVVCSLVLADMKLHKAFAVCALLVATAAGFMLPLANQPYDSLANAHAKAAQKS